MLEGLLVVVVGGALVGGVAWLMHRTQEERVAALRGTAARLGWGFREEVPFHTIPDLDRFELFRQGRSRKLTNVMTSPAGDPRAVIFDYAYTTGGGKSQQTHRQTVIYATSDGLTLPSYSLRPEHFLHSIAKAFGYQDIDIENRPTFSEMFLLRSDDEAGVRTAFTEPVLAFFESRPDACSAGISREVLYWRAGKRVGAEQLEALVADGYALARAFAGRAAAA
jgi:hypothetical protein